MCAEWHSDFPAFERGVGPRPSPAHKLRRIDPYRPLEPNNCRWIEPEEPMEREPQFTDNRRRVPKDQLPFLLEMVAAGTPIVDVAAAFDITQGGVRNILARRGIAAKQNRSADASQYASKLTREDAAALRARYAAGERVKDLAKEYGISLRAGYYVVRGKTWRDA